MDASKEAGLEVKKAIYIYWCVITRMQDKVIA
jgi:hypothetical protein